jgi:hypothetical protein
MPPLESNSRSFCALKTVLKSKYLLIGLIVDFVILFVAGGYLLVSLALSYKGRCGVFWFFGGDGRPCPFHEYMGQELVLLIAGLLEFWWLILLAMPVFLMIPSIAYLLGRLRNNFSSKR